MKPTLIFIILSCIILSSAPITAEKDLEHLLPPDVAVVAKVNNMGQQINQFLDSKLFEILSVLHQMDHPNKPPLRREIEKGLKEPAVQFLKDELIMGIVPPKQKKAQPEVIIIGRGKENLAPHIAKFLEQEIKKQKFHTLGKENYKGQEIEIFLHAEKGRLEKKYLLVHGNIFIFSNKLERVQTCYDCINNEKQGLSTPGIYGKLPADASFRFYIDLQKFDIDLSKKNPAEKKSAELAKFFNHLRSCVKNTRYFAGYLQFDNGVKIRIVRERNEETPAILPMISFPEALLEKRTIAFATLPIPFSIFWHAAKAKALNKNPKGWRQLNAGLEGLFGWADFEQDILPKIGPQVALLVNLPKEKPNLPVILPHATLMLKLSPELNMKEPIKKIWKWALDNKNLAQHISPEPRQIPGGLIVDINLRKNPMAKLLKPAQGIISGAMFLSSDRNELESILKLSQENQKKGYLAAYINFSNILRLVRVNEDFLKKEARKKGNTIPQKKLELLYALFERLGVASLTMKEMGNLELVEFDLEVK